MNKSKKEKDKNYYLEGINLLLKENETLENLSLIFEEYKKAYETRKAIIDNLYNEIKIIKKLKVCPANMNLAGAEVELVSMMSREKKLKV